MPEFFTNSILAPVAACSKTVYVTPFFTTDETLSLAVLAGAAVAPATSRGNSQFGCHIVQCYEDLGYEPEYVLPPSRPTQETPCINIAQTSRNNAKAPDEPRSLSHQQASSGTSLIARCSVAPSEYDVAFHLFTNRPNKGDLPDGDWTKYFKLWSR